MTEAFRVVCQDCRAIGSNRPLTIRELCGSCAEDTAAAHRSRGHRVDIHPPQPEPALKIRRKAGR